MHVGCHPQQQRVPLQRNLISMPYGFSTSGPLTCQKRDVILISKLKASTSRQPVWRARIINDGKVALA